MWGSRNRPYPKLNPRCNVHVVGWLWPWCGGGCPKRTGNLRNPLVAYFIGKCTSHFGIGLGRGKAIAALSPGDPLQVRAGEIRWEILDAGGTVVGQLAREFQPTAGMRFASATVLPIFNWERERSEPQFWRGLRCDAWEVVVPELVFEPDL